MSLDPGDLRITTFCCENPKAEHAHTNYSSAAVLLNFCFSRNGMFLNDSSTKTATCDETPFSRRIDKTIGETYLEASWNLCCHVIPEQRQHLRTSPCSDATQPQRYEQGLDGTLEPQKSKLTAMSLMAPDGLFQSPNYEYFFQP